MEQTSENSSPVADRLGNAFRLAPIQCPICKVDNARKQGLRGGRFQRRNLGIETTIVRCRGCGLLYPNPFPFPTDPQRLYGEPDEYFEGHNLRGKIAAGKKLLEEIRVRTGSERPSVLDVGSGRGELLKAGKDSGLARTVGLEFSRAMVEYARSMWEIDVRQQSIEEHAENNPGAYDAVVLNAVLEHVYRPDLMVRAAARLLRENGVLYVDCPNEPNLVTMVYAAAARARRSPAAINLAPTFPPFHVFGFNPKALNALLRQNGLEVETIDLRGGPVKFKPAGLKDAVKVSLVNAINTIANLTGTAHNMTVWARLVRRAEAESRQALPAYSVGAD